MKSAVDGPVYDILMAGTSTADFIFLNPVILNKFHVIDVILKQWDQRAKTPSHLAAVKVRDEGMAIGCSKMVCSKQTHCLYKKPKRVINTECQRYRWAHGYHCSLADCVEIVLYYFDISKDNCESFTGKTVFVNRQPWHKLHDMSWSNTTTCNSKSV